MDLEILIAECAEYITGIVGHEVSARMPLSIQEERGLVNTIGDPVVWNFVHRTGKASCSGEQVCDMQHVDRITSRLDHARPPRHRRHTHASL